MAIGDLNGDGRPDLAIANRDSDSVSVLLNTTTPGATTPSYAAKTDFTTGDAPRSVAIGDLNGDGRPDLAIANTGSDSVSVLLNTTTPGATTPSYAAKTDFTTGRCSLLGGDRGSQRRRPARPGDRQHGSNSVSVLLNTTTPGATTPSYAAKTDFTTGVRSLLGGDRGSQRRRPARPGDRQLRLGQRVGAAQHDGPGRDHAELRRQDRLHHWELSLLGGDRGSQRRWPARPGDRQLRLEQRVGAAQHDRTPGALPSSRPQDRLHHRVSVPLGGDRGSQRRRPARPGDRQLRTRTACRCCSTPRPRERPRRATPPRPTSPLGVFPTRWRLGISTATAGPTWRSPTATRTACRCCSTPRRRARPRRATPPRPTSPPGQVPVSVAIGDLNGDGRPDLAIANRDSDSVSVLLNTTTPGATTPSYAAKTDFTTGRCSLLGGDRRSQRRRPARPGDRQLQTRTACRCCSTPRRRERPRRATPPRPTSPPGQVPASVAIGDLNGDGRPDLAIANTGSDSVSVLLNTTTPGATTPSYAAKTDFTTGSVPRSVAIGDLNGDGRPDLAIANCGFGQRVGAAQHDDTGRDHAELRRQDRFHHRHTSRLGGDRGSQRRRQARPGDRQLQLGQRVGAAQQPRYDQRQPGNRHDRE